MMKALSAREAIVLSCERRAKRGHSKCAASQRTRGQRLQVTEVNDLLPLWSMRKMRKARQNGGT